MAQKATTSILGNALLAVLALLVSNGCTSLVVNPLLDPLTLSMQKQTDLELLEEGSPSLLLLLDGLIAGDQDNVHLLMAATKAYGAYTTILYEEGKTERAVNMSIKARDYGIRLINQLPGLENLNGQTLAEIDASLDRISLPQVGYLFWGAYGWALWIQHQEGSADAMADLPIVEKIMLRVVDLNESYYYGGAHIFLGSFYGSRPQIYGGKPEESRKHFERALEINNRQFLLTHVAYAQTYARMAFDRELYLELLTEVLEQPLKESEMASSNKLAKVMAEKLITQVDEFF